PGDCFFPDHRSHGLCLLAGSPGEKLMAEIFGKATGVCGGRGGSMHLADASVGNLGGNVVMGSMLATCLGPALTWRIPGQDLVAATQAALDAADYIRAGSGPFFLEFHTWRWQGIFSGEFRDPEEVKLWKGERDPLRRARALILAEGIADEARLDAIRSEIEAQ